MLYRTSLTLRRSAYFPGGIASIGRFAVVCLSLGVLASSACDDEAKDSATVTDGGVVIIDGTPGATDGGPKATDGGPKAMDSGPAATESAPKPTDVMAAAVGACSTPCVAKFINTFATCVPSGACVEQLSSSPTESSNTCYANGVVETLTASPEVKFATYKPGGALCHSGTLDLAAGNYTFKDAAGAVLGVLAPNEKEETILACGGMTFNLTTLKCPGFTDNSDQGECTEGTCTAP